MIPKRGDLIALVSHEIPSRKVNQGTNIKAIWLDVYNTKMSYIRGDEMYNNLLDVVGQIRKQNLELLELHPFEPIPGAEPLNPIISAVGGVGSVALAFLPGPGTIVLGVLAVANFSISAASAHINLKGEESKRLLQLTY